MNQPAFDKEKEYDEKIAPLMTQIIAICKEHDIPMIASFNYRSGHPDDSTKLSFCTTVLPTREGWQSREIVAATHIIRNGLSGRSAV